MSIKLLVIVKYHLHTACPLNIIVTEDFLTQAAYTTSCCHEERTEADMTIQQLDDTRVIIVLCKEDMETLSLKYSTLSFKDAHSRTVIKQLVSVAGHRAGFTLSNHSVAIEALPYNTGCLLVVTLLPKSRNPKRYRIKRDEKIVM